TPAYHSRRSRLNSRARKAVMPLAGVYITAAMLFVAVAPLPYGYYTLLRVVACCVFAFAAYCMANQKAHAASCVFGLFALTFNPLIPIHFAKEVWVVIDVAAGIVLLFAAKPLSKSNSRPQTDG